MKVDRTKTVNGVDISSLSSDQQHYMRVHSGHHSRAHLEEMKNSMERGSDFNTSHIEAMRKVGK
tara:strand:- start:712 stop:903 length:192 start_codon:yes stop_codon:yes gene_type:complete